MTRHGRLRDLAVLLPVGALLIFLPPYVDIFDQPILVLGIPLLPFAIFVLWLVGIVLTAIVARALNRADAELHVLPDGSADDPPAPTASSDGDVRGR
ncbi:MAG: hypothetical protein RLO50_19465 [Azospirillaceae bacterium]